MIRNTFLILPGIGHARERRLWEMGVLDWRGFTDRKRIPMFSPARKSMLDGLIGNAQEALDSGDYRYLGGLLGTPGIWRLWDELEKDAVCLDIETDGAPAHEGGVTVAGFCSHGEYRAYVKGVNLDKDALAAEFEGARLLVSFFGSGFDLPYLKAAFPGLHVDVPHLDLCPAGHGAGLKGGLKKVEKVVGITRADEVDGMDGYEAVLLWRAHLAGKEGALDRLVSYNREDTVNLHTLAWIIYERLRELSGLPAIMAGAVPGAPPHPAA
ncbi:MAG TPA: ribonuclease H-like domain-containing protein [Nitrospirota bacterium]